MLVVAVFFIEQNKLKRCLMYNWKILSMSSGSNDASFLCNSKVEGVVGVYDLLGRIVAYQLRGKKNGNYLILYIFLLVKILSFLISILTTCRFLNIKAKNPSSHFQKLENRPARGMYLHPFQH